MRRARDLREHKEALRRRAEAKRGRIVEQNKRAKAYDDASVSQRKKANEARKRKIDQGVVVGSKHGIASKVPLVLHFKKFKDYKCSRSEPIKVCHIIDSLGMGGGQTMMMELILGLNRYYKGDVVNMPIHPKRASPRNYEKQLWTSYGVVPQNMNEKEVGRFIEKRNCDIVLHHRLSASRCYKSMVPKKTKYVVLNHTYHRLEQVRNFHADAYVSVCQFLHQITKMPSFVHPSRHLVILNGVENDYISDLKINEKMRGTFKTGRCHRLVGTKFKIDSLDWIEKKVQKAIPGHAHYVLGFNRESMLKCKKLRTCHHLGAVSDRNKKMSILKGLDTYFYETFQQEGASMAILESLACGVPVLCKDYGGNKELVKNKVNGFILSDRGSFLKRMVQLANDPDLLQKMKQNSIDDFNKRLHIKHTACKYMQLFEALL